MAMANIDMRKSYEFYQFWAKLSQNEKHLMTSFQENENTSGHFTFVPLKCRNFMQNK